MSSTSKAATVRSTGSIGRSKIANAVSPPH
jgi:hypothetical protein